MHKDKQKFDFNVECTFDDYVRGVDGATLSEAVNNLIVSLSYQNYIRATIRTREGKELATFDEYNGWVSKSDDVLIDD